LSVRFAQGSVRHEIKIENDRFLSCAERITNFSLSLFECQINWIFRTKGKRVTRYLHGFLSFAQHSDGKKAAGFHFASKTQLLEIFIEQDSQKNLIQGIAIFLCAIR
jgi:hypothetical protein